MGNGGTSACSLQAGTCARNVDVERKMNMENEKKYIEIRIKMDENGQITPNSKMSNVNGDDVIACYLAGAVYVANVVADCSNGKHDAKQVLGAMLTRFSLVLAHFDEIMEKEED